MSSEHARSLQNHSLERNKFPVRGRDPARGKGDAFSRRYRGMQGTMHLTRAAGGCMTTFRTDASGVRPMQKEESLSDDPIQCRGIHTLTGRLNVELLR